MPMSSMRLCWVSIQSRCSSSPTSRCSSSSRVPASPWSRHSRTPVRYRSMACSSSCRSRASCSGTVSPIITVPSRCMLGSASSSRMRSMSFSASRISSTDSSWYLEANRSYPQLPAIFEAAKYWLMAVSSAVSASFKNSMTSGDPCMNSTLRACRSNPNRQTTAHAGCCFPPVFAPVAGRSGPGPRS